MKTIYKSLRNISLALCATMAISSCDSFLDTKPYDFVAPQTNRNVQWLWPEFITH